MTRVEERRVSGLLVWFLPHVLKCLTVSVILEEDVCVAVRTCDGLGGPVERSRIVSRTVCPQRGLDE